MPPPPFFFFCSVRNSPSMAHHGESPGFQYFRTISRQTFSMKVHKACDCTISNYYRVPKCSTYMYSLSIDTNLLTEIFNHVSLYMYGWHLRPKWQLKLSQVCSAHSLYIWTYAFECRVVNVLFGKFTTGICSHKRALEA